MEKKELKIHGIYIILILTSIIICLTAFRMGDNEKMFNYISFAATISSILLAVIAIIYSFYSNSSMSQSLGSLGSISKDVAKNTLQMTEAAEKLKSKIEEIPIYLKPIEDKADLTNSRLEQLSKGPQISSPTIIDKDIKLSYISNSSFLGLKSLYCAILSFQKSKPFKYNNINTLSPNNNEMYMYAYFIATSSLGLIRYSIADYVISITNVDPILLENLKDIIYRRAGEADTNNNPELRTWKAEVESIENYFSVT
jgi:hypothetical protein